ncbi:MAG: prepilin-type N-terminal cleavage/methylation domain-containing protein [Pseudomonadota bacterium]
MNRPPRTRQRGLSLIEALVSFAVAAIGMTALVVSQASLRHNADTSRQRAEALRLAHEQMEHLRAFASFEDYQQLAGQSGEHDADSPAGTRFAIRRELDGSATAAALEAAVNARWTERSGRTARVALHSVIAGLDPALSGALLVRQAASTAHLPHGRSLAIPPQATDLGDGRSAFSPPGAAGITWIFDNRSGMVTSVCEAPAATRALSFDAGPDRCLARQGLVVSGHVRFATGASAVQPNAAALDLEMRLSTQDGHAQCFDDASAQAPRNRVVYHCLVTPAPHKTAWSGRLDVVPAGWTLGHEDPAYRVCRYSADLDGRDGIGNHEHPLDYRGVAGALRHQNFLVVRGSQPCPTEGVRTVEQAPQPQDTPQG